MTTLNLKNKKLGLISSAVFILMLLTGCDKREPYYRFEQIKDAEWKQTDTLVFTIDSTIVSPNKVYDISVEISNNNKYSYRNLWVYTTINASPKDSISDTIPKEYVLADKFGKWNGAGFGSLYQSSFPLKEGFTFLQGSNYNIKLIHAMRDEPLRGIEKVGIKLSEHGS